MKRENVKKILKIITIIICIGLIIITALMIKNDLFKNPKNIVKIVEKYGPFGMIVFILIQIVQVILPIMPGGICNLAGVV